MSQFTVPAIVAFILSSLAMGYVFWPEIVRASNYVRKLSNENKQEASSSMSSDKEKGDKVIEQPSSVVHNYSSGGGAFSINQTGGVTANTVNLISEPSPPRLDAKTQQHLLSKIPRDRPIRMIVLGRFYAKFGMELGPFLASQGYRFAHSEVNLNTSFPSSQQTGIFVRDDHTYICLNSDMKAPI